MAVNFAIRVGYSVAGFVYVLTERTGVQPWLILPLYARHILATRRGCNAALSDAKLIVALGAGGRGAAERNITQYLYGYYPGLQRSIV